MRPSTTIWPPQTPQVPAAAGHRRDRPPGPGSRRRSPGHGSAAPASRRTRARGRAPGTAIRCWVSSPQPHPD